MPSEPHSWSLDDGEFMVKEEQLRQLLTQIVRDEMSHFTFRLENCMREGAASEQEPLLGRKKQSVRPYAPSSPVQRQRRRTCLPTGDEELAFDPDLGWTVRPKECASRKSRASVRKDAYGASVLDDVSRISCHFSPDVIDSGDGTADELLEGRSRNFMSVACDVQTATRNFVESDSYELVLGALLIVNSLLVGLEADYAVKGGYEAIPSLIIETQVVLNIVFILEIGCRVCILGCSRFLGGEYGKWNTFDLFVNGMQVMQFWRLLNQVQNAGIGPFASLVRMLRVLRLLRLLRALRRIRELRLVVASVAGSIKCLASMIILLSTTSFVFGTLLTQMVADFCIEYPDEDETQQEIKRYFGSLSLSMLSLFASYTEGLHWMDLMLPLQRMSPILATAFLLYVAFSLLAMMNIVTGLFCESAMRIAGEENTKATAEQVCEMFMAMDQDKSGTLNFAEFRAACDTNEDLMDYFDNLGISRDIAYKLFFIIDRDGSGEIEPQEFATGICRFHGDVKAVDFAAFMLEWKNFSDRLPGNIMEDDLSQWQGHQ